MLNSKLFSVVSPKPQLQLFKLGPEFTGCSDPDSEAETLSSFEERLTTSLPCVLSEECVVSDLSCVVSENCTTLSVMVTPQVLQHVMEQRLILETAVDYLNAVPFHRILGDQSVCESSLVLLLYLCKYVIAVY